MDASEETGCETIDDCNYTNNSNNQTNISHNQTNNSNNQTNNSKNQTNNSNNQTNNSKYGPKPCKQKCNKILAIVSLVVAIVALLVCIALRFAYPADEIKGPVSFKMNCGDKLRTTAPKLKYATKIWRSKRRSNRHDEPKRKSHYDEARAVWALLVLGLGMAMTALVLFCVKSCRKCHLAIFLLALFGCLFSAIGLFLAIYLIADCESDIEDMKDRMAAVSQSFNPRSDRYGK